MAKKNLKSIGYVVEEVSTKEFYDFMTGEIFSEDTITLVDVLENDYLMIHEVVEINELKKMGRIINSRVIMDSPKTIIYEAHLIALEKELEYALYRKDYSWIKIRLRQYKESILESDSNLPVHMKPKAEAIYEKFLKVVQKKQTKLFCEERKI